MYKNIKWSNKELPGITHEELAELTASKLAKQDAGKIAGEINVKSGEVFNALNKAWERRDELIESGEFSEMAAKGYAGIKDKEAHTNHMRSIQVEGRAAAKKVTKEKAISKNEKILSELLSTMESDKWYTANEISILYDYFAQAKYVDKKVRRFVLKNQDSFKVDYNSHQTKLFKKI